MTEEEEALEEKGKERKKSMRSFETIYKIDPTIVDEFTDELALPRGVQNISSHTRDGIVPVAVSRFSRFITVHVGNTYGSARCIPYVVLFRGKGNGSVEVAEMCFKKKRCFKGRELRNMKEWNCKKIDLNELKRYGEKGVRYSREDVDMIPVDVRSLVKIQESESADVEVEF